MQCNHDAIEEVVLQVRGLMRVILASPLLGLPADVSKRTAERIADAVRLILRSTTWT